MITNQEVLSQRLVAVGIPASSFEHGTVRIASVCYLFYWVNRLKNNTEEQVKATTLLFEYLKFREDQGSALLQLALEDEVKQFCEQYVLEEMPRVKTVDLVVERAGATPGLREILLYVRDRFPAGLALPGGLIQDTDESNVLAIPTEVFSALRVAADKVLSLSPDDRVYERKLSSEDREYFCVSNKQGTRSIIIQPKSIYGYEYVENIRNIIRPSDPRHIVHTVGFLCSLVDTTDTPLHSSFMWVTKDALLEPGIIHLTFNHHKEVVFHILAKSSVEQEATFLEADFIKSIVHNPLEKYTFFQQRFEANYNNPNTSFPELFSVVHRLLSELFSESVSAACAEVEILNGMRDKVAISLRHVSLKNRTFCPYLPTVRAIFEAIAFFDILARSNKGFYQGLTTEKIIEHNPKEKPFASYHMYRYKYRLDDMLRMVPGEIIIPTFSALSATDLMKVRGIPVRFVGLTTDFLYVDEFEQSPEEFLMHDCNHSWRMIHEDTVAAAELGLDQPTLIAQSNDFITEYLGQIKIQQSDSEKERELKKIKKIILFEIVHEDARPFLREIIGQYIQVKEGGEVRFEMPRIDPLTGYMDVVDTLDTGISTLSYVRNKLQHGFYDHVDSQLPQIVDPAYRKSQYIAEAAYQMLRELQAISVPGAEIDTDGLPTYEWLLRRVCSVGPDNIHAVNEVDEILAMYTDGAEKLNPKRYQA